MYIIKYEYYDDDHDYTPSWEDRLEEVSHASLSQELFSMRKFPSTYRNIKLLEAKEIEIPETIQWGIERLENDRKKELEELRIKNEQNRLIEEKAAEEKDRLEYLRLKNKFEKQ
jgi:hypothetical protein